MVLNIDPAYIPWMPRNQNSMITVTSSSGTITYNPEFFVMKHFSYYIKQGAARMLVTRSDSALCPLAYKNPDGTIITIIANNSDSGIATTIRLGNRFLEVTNPARGLHQYLQHGRYRRYFGLDRCRHSNEAAAESRNRGSSPGMYPSPSLTSGAELSGTTSWE